MLNRIILIGRLTQDPELKYTPQGVPLAKFGLAVNRSFKNAQGEREVDFFNIIAWRQKAEFISQYATKGKMIAVEGRVEIRNYVAQDGSKRSSTEVIADNFELLDSSRDAAGGGGTGGGAPSGGYSDQAPAGAPDVDEFADPFSES